jgi:hypothetical protein
MDSKAAYLCAECAIPVGQAVSYLCGHVACDHCFLNSPDGAICSKCISPLKGKSTTSDGTLEDDNVCKCVENSKISSFCVSCRLLVCLNCTRDLHAGHILLDPHVAADRLRGILSRTISSAQDLERLKSRYAPSSTALGSEEAHFNSIYKTRDAINRYCDDLISAVEQLRKNTLNELSRCEAGNGFVMAQLAKLDSCSSAASELLTSEDESVCTYGTRAIKDLCDIINSVAVAPHEATETAGIDASGVVMLRCSLPAAMKAISEAVQIASTPPPPISVRIEYVDSGKLLLTWDVPEDVRYLTSNIMYEVQMKSLNSVESDASAENTGFVTCGSFKTTNLVVDCRHGSVVSVRVRCVSISGAHSTWSHSNTVQTPSLKYFAIEYLEHGVDQGIIHWIETKGRNIPWRNGSPSCSVKVFKYVFSEAQHDRNGAAHARRHRGLAQPMVAATKGDEHWFIAKQEYQRDDSGFFKKIKLCLSSGLDEAWIAVDLGSSVSARVSRYCLGFDSHINHEAISWVLQGASNLDGPWITIHTHAHKPLSTAFHKHESRGSWEVNRCDEYFRFFRVFQAPNDDKHKSGFRGQPLLACTGFEIYGSLKLIDSQI